MAERGRKYFLQMICRLSFQLMVMVYPFDKSQDLVCLNQICTVKNIRRFYGKITGNQLPVHFPFFLRAPVNIFRNQAQYGSKKTCIAFGHRALKGIFECCRLT